MKKIQRIKWKFIILAACAGVALSFFGIKPGKAAAETAKKQTVFGAVPYFKDDFGLKTQLVDGWLYSYWSRSLCRYNPDTMEEEVLYEALSPQDGSFCVDEGYIYFIEKPNVSFLGNVTCTLYRMRCDGSGLTALADELALPERYCRYDLMVYDGILYLLPGTPDMESALYFRLEGGELSGQLEVEETVYGRLDKAYEDACFSNRYSSFPPLPYCLKHYDCGFVVDGEENLCFYDTKSGAAEQITALAKEKEQIYGQCILTNNAIVYRDEDAVWYTVSLEKTSVSRRLGSLDCYAFDFWDEKGLYTVAREDDHLKVRRLGWDGGEETLHYWIRNSCLSTSVYGDYVRLLYSDGKYLYYDGMQEGDGVIYRILLEDKDNTAEPELFAVYYDSPVKDISTRETVSTTYQVDETGDTGEFSVTRVYLTEETAGAKEINARLDEIYAVWQEDIERTKEEVRLEAFSEYKSSWRWSSTLYEISYAASIEYLDENNIGFCVSWYQYSSGAAHGLYGETHYVFDRKLGKRLALTDVVEDTPEDACRIIAPYVEAVAEWGITEDESWEKMILDEGRFYLTEEGIGVHFDVYEIACYAAGSQDIIVPYEKFRMKKDAETGKEKLVWY